jgi:ABC-type uncharacterized transport system fused permease/ATPase subunit
VVIDEVFDSLDEATLATVKDVFAHELKATGLIHIGRKQDAGPPYVRVLHLVNDPDARRLSRAPEVSQDNSARQRGKEVVRASG